MRILFCGGTFPAAHGLLRQRLTPGAGYEVAASEVAQLRTAPDDADVLIPLMCRVDTAIMELTRCRLIQQWGTGLDGVDLDAARRRGIWVANVPSTGSNAVSVAEHVLLLTLATLRQMDSARANLRAGVLGAPIGRMLAGRSTCLYGLGATALAVSARMRAFNVRLIGITRDPSAPKVAAFKLDACYATHERMPALARAQILVLCTALCDETRGMIDAGALAALPAGALLINAARAGLVDHAALHSALATGHLAGAGLDVFWDEPVDPDDPLLSLPNVVATPHIAGVTDGSYGEIADAVATNIVRLRRGEPPLNRAA